MCAGFYMRAHSLEVRLRRPHGYTFFDCSVFPDTITSHHHRSKQNQDSYTGQNDPHDNGICMERARVNKCFEVFNKVMQQLYNVHAIMDSDV